MNGGRCRCGWNRHRSRPDLPPQRDANLDPAICRCFVFESSPTNVASSSGKSNPRMSGDTARRWVIPTAQAHDSCRTASRNLANWQACFQPLSSRIPAPENHAFSVTCPEFSRKSDFHAIPPEKAPRVRDRGRWYRGEKEAGDRSVAYEPCLRCGTLPSTQGAITRLRRSAKCAGAATGRQAPPTSLARRAQPPRLSMRRKSAGRSAPVVITASA